MEITLKVKPQVLKSKATSIRSSITSLEKELTSIGNVIIGTTKYWEGDASVQHQKYYDAIKEDIPTVLKRLKEHPNELLTMAGIYDKAEDTNEQLASSLPSNIIV